MTASNSERHADMSATLPPTALRTLSVPVEFFGGLRAAASTPDAIRDAGFVAGQALFEHFASWLADQGEAAPTALSDEQFPWLLQAFFHGLGWGRVELVPLSEAVMALDTSEWGEADANGSTGGCLVSTGVFAGFFGRLADAPIAVLEVEPELAAPGRCRFLLGSVDVMEYVWEAMERGIPYDRAAASA
ncbi:MAG: hypothetical protein IBJ03_00175 [Gemmatimonadaceae bacterium]|nr:hypothetical protein [Gemmatimonadaceae bacterium]